MIDRLPPPVLTALRDKFLSGEDARMLTHLGYYLQWFAATEVNITTILAIVLKIPRMEQFEYVIRGMDARVKCERLRQATKAYCPMGDNLKASFGIFEQECIPLRNQVAHSWTFFDHASCIIYLAKFGRLPVSVNAGRIEFIESNPQKIHIDDLFSQAMWLSAFSIDLQTAMARIIVGEALEVDDPKSRLPLGDLLAIPQPDNPAKPDMPEQMPAEQAPPENQGK